MVPLSDDDQEEKRICFACVGEDYLSADIEKHGDVAECSYCGEEQASITIEELADHVEAAFAQHYRKTSTEPSSLEYALIKEGDLNWERSGEQLSYAIGEAAEIDEEPAADVQKVLEDRHFDIEEAKMGEESEFGPDSYYERIGPNDIEFRENWRYFERSLRTETRFFNKTAEATLSSVFEGLANHETRDNKRVVVEAGPSKEISVLYRARAFHSDEELERALARPDIEVGPPPPNVARAGRMNAQGISVFYGATDPDVALAEIRPPVGSRVVVGKFGLQRPLRLLDVAALESVFVKGSIFDGGYIRRLEQAKFLERLSRRIAEPVMPTDEASDYLITQAIADYLATEVNLDGIIYPSAQAGGKGQNVVLFHNAARVKSMELPPGTEISASLYWHTDEGPEVDYRVWEETPPSPKPKKAEPESEPKSIIFFEPSPELPWDADLRPETLQLDPASVRVRHITAVSFTTEDHEVQRHRTEKVKPPF